MFQKIEQFIFYILIFSIPFQTRIILFQGNPFNEWNGVYFYFTDLLLGPLFILWGIHRWTQIRKQINADKNKQIYADRKYPLLIIYRLLLFLFFIAAGVSLFKAQNLGVGFFRWLKLGEFILLFFYCKSKLTQIRTQIDADNKNYPPSKSSPLSMEGEGKGGGAMYSLKRIFQILVVSGVFQALIAIGQFFSQSDLGLKHFEAGPLGPEIAGVAKIALAGGAKMIRAYGMFPHPNVLAAFLLAAIFCFYYLLITRRSTQMRAQIFAGKINVYKNYLSLIIYYLYYLLLGVLIFALFLTFSRTAIFAFIAGSFVSFFILIRKFAFNSDKIRVIIRIFFLFIVYVSLFTIILWPELSSRVYFTGESENLALRSFYNRSALSIIKNSSFLGVGIGNFVQNLELQVTSYKLQDWAFQPVHNLYLLIASETGLVGLGVFLLFVILFFKKAFARIRIKSESNPNESSYTSSFITYYLLLITFAFFFLAFFDHYFWTLQQGGLIFWMILGVLAALKKTR